MAGVDTDRDIQDLETALFDYGVPEDGLVELTRAIQDAEMTPRLAIPLDDLTTSAAPGPTRSLDEAPAVELSVDAPTEDEGQVILEVDAAGVVSWHFPVATEDGWTARAGVEQVFRIPVLQADIPGDPPAATDRALFGIGARKILHVLRYPIQQAAGWAANSVVSHWEARHRPYGLRSLGGAGLTDGPRLALTGDQLASLHGKPTLLLVHGTFSTGAAGFEGFISDAALLAELRRRYEGRVLVFDHPSVSASPVANARWLLDQFPPDSDLVLDVVAHSRGGLVGRALFAEPTFERSAARPPHVRRMVHVATPNRGTTLASTEKWGTLLDVVTNLAMALPDTASVPLSIVVEVVKQVGTGSVEGLDGLASMDPEGEQLQGLTPRPGVGTPALFTIASDYEPLSGSVPLRALDLMVDTFFGEANDLVVPTEGVSAIPGLKVEEAVAMPSMPALNHTGFFRDAQVRQQLSQWLPG